MKEYYMTEEIAQNRSVWHMKTKAGPLLHGGGLFALFTNSPYWNDNEAASANGESGM